MQSDVVLNVTQQEEDKLDLPVHQEKSTNEEAESSSSSESSSGDESGSEESTSSDKNHEKDEDDTPVRRKIAYDCAAQLFSEAEISPASLDKGKDTRELDHLQKILLEHPETILAVDSMLQVIKAMSQDQAQAAQGVARAPNAPESHGVMPPPPPMANVPRPLPGPGESETTIYTQGVPSASPSRVYAHGQGDQLNRFLATDLNLADQTVSDHNLTLSENRHQGVHELSQDSSFPAQSSGNLGQPNPVIQHNTVAEERQAAKARTDQLIVEAEQQRLTLEKPITGNETAGAGNATQARRHSVLDQPGSDDLECDNKLYGLSVHLDHKLKEHIIAGEYVELSLLLPKDKVVPD